MIPDAKARDLGFKSNCFVISIPRSLSVPARLTTMPAAVETMSAGI